MEPRFFLQFGDITAVKVDAIVNSADEGLLTGGPVHAAVHKAAGPGLLAECATLGGCPRGEARVTRAYSLPFRFILHTVAPTWMSGIQGEAEALASCYRSCLEMAGARGAHSLAFPSLGSGLLPQIPLEAAAPIAIRTILGFLDEHELPERVVLVCFDGATYQAYQHALREAMP